MRTIQLSGGRMQTVVDDADYDGLMAMGRWSAIGPDASGQYRAGRWLYADDGSKKLIYMHRYLMGVTDRAVEIDHISGDSLDNRVSCNLRTCTRAQNGKSKHQRNQRMHGQVNIKGVQKARRAKKYTSTIQSDGEIHRLGSYACPAMAGIEYRLAAVKLHGAFASFK